MALLLRNHNYDRIDDLKQRLTDVKSWRKEFYFSDLANRSEKLALVNVMIEHFTDFICAYEDKNVRKIVEAANRHVILAKIALEILE